MDQITTMLAAFLCGMLFTHIYLFIFILIMTKKLFNNNEKEHKND